MWGRVLTCEGSVMIKVGASSKFDCSFGSICDSVFFACGIFGLALDRVPWVFEIFLKPACGLSHSEKISFCRCIRLILSVIMLHCPAHLETFVVAALGEFYLIMDLKIVICSETN